MYPDGWPRCVTCGDFALDGHLTCGRHECDEARARDGEADEYLRRRIERESAIVDYDEDYGRMEL